MGHVPQADSELEAALRRLRAAFGLVEVLEVIDHRADQDPAKPPVTASPPPPETPDTDQP